MENRKHLFIVIEPSADLKKSILRRIRTEETKVTIYKIVLTSVISLASLSTLSLFMINVVKDAYQSGLAQYLSLIFSDGYSIISMWQSYLMSILESVPVVPITIVVASIFVFIWSINSVLEMSKVYKLRIINN